LFGLGGLGFAGAAQGGEEEEAATKADAKKDGSAMEKKSAWGLGFASGAKGGGGGEESEQQAKAASPSSTQREGEVATTGEGEGAGGLFFWCGGPNDAVDEVVQVDNEESCVDAEEIKAADGIMYWVDRKTKDVYDDDGNVIGKYSAMTNKVSLKKKKN